MNYSIFWETFLRMNYHIYECTEARNLKKVKLLFLVLAVSVILAVFVHFSLSNGAIDPTTATRYHPNEVTNPDSAFKESTGNTTNAVTYFNIPERDDQTIDEQPGKASCPDAVNSTESHEQVSDVPSYENVPTPAPLPDGRIFMRGEPPYGYLPTCSPKDRNMPFFPVEPD
jgi:hypothetical protein